MFKEISKRFLPIAAALSIGGEPVVLERQALANSTSVVERAPDGLSELRDLLKKYSELKVTAEPEVLDVQFEISPSQHLKIARGAAGYDVTYSSSITTETKRFDSADQLTQQLEKFLPLIRELRTQQEANDTYLKNAAPSEDRLAVDKDYRKIYNSMKEAQLNFVDATVTAFTSLDRISKPWRSARGLAKHVRETYGHKAIAQQEANSKPVQVKFKIENSNYGYEFPVTLENTESGVRIILDDNSDRAEPVHYDKIIPLEKLDQFFAAIDAWHAKKLDDIILSPENKTKLDNDSTPDSRTRTENLLKRTQVLVGITTVFEKYLK